MRPEEDYRLALLSRREATVLELPRWMAVPANTRNSRISEAGEVPSLYEPIRKDSEEWVLRSKVPEAVFSKYSLPWPRANAP